MSLSPGEVVDKCRSEYVTRLLNRNPLLHFSPTSNRFDARDIFEGVMVNAPARATGNGGTATAVSDVRRLVEVLAQGKRARVVGPTRTVSAKCSKIRVVSTDIQRMSGQQSLFVGYPLLYAEVDGKVPILAPLFLIPVTISSVSATAIEFSGGAVRVNPLLPEWCNLYQDVKISAESLVLNDFLSDDEEPHSPIAWRQMTTALLQPWIGVEGIDSVGDDHFDIAPTVKALKELQAAGAQAHVLNSAVLGVARFNGQALLDDLTRLAKMAPDSLGQNVLGLVAPRQERHQPSAEYLPDSERWSVIATDPTQDMAIAQIQISPCLVIQGPPGTGKSQTIVNMISQALASGESVAVFCEKRSALEVVKKRMEANDLGALCQLIDDPVGQRQAIITATREIQRDAGDALTNTAPTDHALISKTVESLEEKIDERMAAFFRSEEPIRERYADLRCRLAQLSEPQGQYRSAFEKIKSTLAEERLDISFNGETALFLRQVQAWQEQAVSCDFDHSPWRALRADIDVDFQSLHLWLTAVEAHWNCTLPVPTQALYWLNIHAISAAWTGTFLETNARAALAVMHAAAVALDRLKSMTGIGPASPQVAADLLHAKTSTEFILPSWKETLGNAGDVHALSRELTQHKVGALLRVSYGGDSRKWLDIVKAAIFENMLTRLELENPSVYAAVGPLKADIRRLGELLDKHEESSRRSVKGNFHLRLAPMQVLRDRELLRLRGNSASGRKKSELRDLYSLAGFDSMKKLHPVLLSTPEVACALLPLKAGLFGLVIVDEASQMFVAEALPLLFRGKRVVIAGDAKQMPPSDFFTADVSDGGEGEDGDDQSQDDSEELLTRNPTAIPALDGESVLEAAEAALAAGSPAQRMLEMHYRSAFAELIEFSNHAFYDGRLLAPPGNPAVKAVLPKPITFYRVNGAFLKGVNRIEAEEIVRFLSTLWLAENSPSVGIIVMNVVQRDHINNLLQIQAQEDVGFAERLERERNRKNDGEDIGLFVRSVEHVQGDERDLIVFGTTYAGDSRMFGPISKASRGRRRLNVAVTRAKKGMAVFCSLNIAHMASIADNGNDRWYFQQYLRYAEAVSNGDGPKVNALLEMLNPRLAAVKNAAMFESPFEEDVATFLAENGYESEPQKPETEFRIDLAVKRRDGLGYICGIECDGAQFHADWRARSRDIWRQRILESKGWHIERVWSTDWFRNPKNTKLKLMEIIRRIELEGANSVAPFSFQLKTISVGDDAANAELSSHSVRPPYGTEKSVSSAMAGTATAAAQTVESKEVQIGDTVTFKYIDELMPRHVRIVPLNQPCDRANGIIWPRDPLALALLGSEVGGRAEVLLPTGKRVAEILEIQ
jgi:transcription elongation GreA/GreB family factor/very-short-patch-repair endonuclease/KaiC/GvpD/RAD55 family RecA-like ATPase